VKRVVLVRTAGPRNAGAAMRAVANFGPAELWFVAPERPSLLFHPEFEQMAHGVENVRERIRVVATLEEALADCHRSWGFTARVRGSRARRDWSAARREVQAADRGGQNVALVFGSEESGLSIEETDQLQELCYLSTSTEHTSINLAMAMGIVLSSLFSAGDAHGNEEAVPLVTGDDLAYLKEHLKAVLGGQVARGEAARRDIEGAVERVFSRSPIEGRDARAWHMMMRALGSRRTPQDFGLERTPKSRRRKRMLSRALDRADGEPEADDPGSGDPGSDDPGADVAARGTGRAGPPADPDGDRGRAGPEG
jgi:TrmH family RNA methyltransferase